MNYFRAFLRALRDERGRARRKWMYRDRLVKQPPKFDPRSSIKLHHRMIASK